MYENDMSNPYNWTGIVEDRDDPLLTNRLRIRIFGFHNTNKVILPTHCLPWAMVGLPVNAPRATSGPKVGDWVIGFFMDGEAGQFPVVTHVLPGINTTVVKQPIGSPYMPAGETFDRKGQPSTPPLGRGVVKNTAIDKSNRQLEHVCDISIEVDRAVNAARFYYGSVVAEIRIALKALLLAEDADVTGIFKSTIEVLKQINAFIKEIKDLADSITEAIRFFVTIIRKVVNIIQYILSLPNKFLKMFLDCLSKLRKQIAAGIKDLFAPLGGGDSPLADFAELQQQASDLGDSFKGIAKDIKYIATVPTVLKAVVLTPSTAKEARQAAIDLTSIIDTHVTDTTATKPATSPSPLANITSP